MFGFPLLLIPLAICNIIVFLMPTLSLTAALTTVPLVSGAVWTVTLSDAILAFSILMLMFEVIKGARPGGKYFTDHLLALLVFAAAAAEFVMLPPFGNSTFFLLTLLTLVDFFSGIALRARRPRKVVATAPVVEPTPVPVPAPVVAREPTFTPAPVPTPMTAETVVPPQPVPHVPTSPELTAQVEPIVADEPPGEIKRENEQPKVQSPGLAPGQSTPTGPDHPTR
jgi:hypothetical protein